MGIRKSGLLLCCVFLTVMLGCSSEHTKGKVFVNDMPVPIGTVMINPDIDSGADGESVLGDIVDGTYTTLEGKSVTLGDNMVYLTVAKKWLTSGGTDISAMDESGAFSTLTQKFTFTEDDLDMKFEFDPAKDLDNEEAEN